MKVFIGFADVAGFASRLGSLLAKSGHEVVWINTAPNYLNPQTEKQEGVREIAPWFFRFSKRLKDKFYPLYFVLTPLLYVGKFAAYVSGLRQSEVMVFLGCGNLLPGYLDRQLGRATGRRTINVFLGSASRPVIMGGSGLHMAEKSDRQLRKLARKLRRQRRRVGEIAEICDEIVENPLCSQFQPRECVDWFRLGFPSGGELFEAAAGESLENESEVVTVLHGPSKPRIKGTDRIRQVIEKLSAEGLPIDYVEITGIPHAEVLKRIARCDFVIDELYSDSPLAGFASEAAWFSKPAVVGGYGWELLRKLPSGEWMAPSATCRPEELEETVRSLVTDRARREELGADAKRYADEFLGLPGFVDRFENVLNGEVPEEWYFDPREICYIHGLGQSEEDLRAGLKCYVDRFGVEGLCFDERTDLERALGEFVSAGSA